MTYDELVTNIRNYTEVGSNVFTASVINTFITMAENRILRDIDLDVFKLEATGALTATATVTWSATATTPASNN